MFKRIIYFIVLLSTLASCGGDSDSDPENIPDRVSGNSIPQKFVGSTANNTRYYDANSNGYKLSVSVSGLSDALALKLEDEVLTISNDGLHLFSTTFVAGTQAIVEVENQPHLQKCEFDGADRIIIKADSTVQLSVSCTDSNVPDSPLVTHIYSASTDSISLEWDSSSDRDTEASQIKYNIYWSTIEDDVSGLTSQLKTANYGQLSANIDNLQPNTTYFIAIQSQDDDGNMSDLSDIYSLKTIESSPSFKNVNYYDISESEIIINSDVWQIASTNFNTSPQPSELIVTEIDNKQVIAKVEAVNLLSNDSYRLEISKGYIGDIFDSIAISNQITITDIVSLQKSNMSKSNTKLKTSPSTKSLGFSFCKTLTTELSDEEINALEVNIIRDITPSIKNNLELETPLFDSPKLTGDIEFLGEIILGINVGFEIASKLTGEVTCALQGLPKTVSFKYPIPGTPLFVYQDISFDIEIKFSFESFGEFKGDVEAIATASLNAKLSYNEQSNSWETTANPTFGYSTDNSLRYALGFKARAAILPTISTTLYKIATTTLTVDSGVQADVVVELIGEDDQFAEFRSVPFILKDFKVGADANFKLGADITIFGDKLWEYPSTSIYQSPSFELFNTPETCVNNAVTKESCESFKMISAQGESTRYDLQLYTIDGKNNPIDLSSIRWKVTPNNGYVEVNKDDPRKAIFVSTDKGAYTVVASGKGVLGDIARKYSTFALSSECTFGLGQNLGSEYDQYFQITHPFPNTGLVDDGIYIFPDGVIAGDPSKYHTEVCDYSHRNEGGATGQAEFVTFYGGMKNGLELYSYEDTFNGSYVYEEYTYDKGLLIRRKIKYYYGLESPSTRTSSLIEVIYDYQPVDDPLTNSTFKRSALYQKTDIHVNWNLLNVEHTDFPIKYETIPDNAKFIENIYIYDVGNSTFTQTNYYANGKKRSHAVSSPIELNLEENYTTLHYSTVYPPDYDLSKSYYENGYLSREDDWVSGTHKTCGWAESEEQSRSSWSDKPLPGTYYKCESY